MSDEHGYGRGQPIGSPGGVELAPVPGLSPLQGFLDTRTFTRTGYLEVTADPASVPRARSYLRQILTQWQLAAIEDEAALLASELVTNAVTATTASTEQATIALYVMQRQRQLTLLVWDCGSGIPQRQAASEDDLDGRGLAIVEALSTQWGYYHARHGGKVVWAELALPSPEPSPVPLQRRLVATYIDGPRNVESVEDLDLLGRVRQGLLDL